MRLLVSCESQLKEDVVLCHLTYRTNPLSCFLVTLCSFGETGSNGVVCYWFSIWQMQQQGTPSLIIWLLLTCSCWLDPLDICRCICEACIVLFIAPNIDLLLFNYVFHSMNLHINYLKLIFKSSVNAYLFYTLIISETATSSRRK